MHLWKMVYSLFLSALITGCWSMEAVVWCHGTNFMGNVKHVYIVRNTEFEPFRLQVPFRISPLAVTRLILQLLSLVMKNSYLVRALSFTD
ncbi:hypothetical protein BDW62DRAFT_146142 [Aspergillus aurantiobrunneus]